LSAIKLGEFGCVGATYEFTFACNSTATAGPMVIIWPDDSTIVRRGCKPVDSLEIISIRITNEFT
jgi:hypothetical protein